MVNKNHFEYFSTYKNHKYCVTVNKHQPKLDCCAMRPQNSACGIVTPRRDTRLICTFLREVWGGWKGEGNVPSVRASTQPDTTVGTVRFCTRTFRISIALNPVCVPCI